MNKEMNFTVAPAMNGPGSQQRRSATLPDSPDLGAIRAGLLAAVSEHHAQKALGRSKTVFHGGAR